METDAGFVVDYRILKGQDKKFIKMTQFICCSFYFFSPPESGAFSEGFTINLSSQCRAFTRALHLKI